MSKRRPGIAFSREEAVRPYEYSGRYGGRRRAGTMPAIEGWEAHLPPGYVMEFDNPFARAHRNTGNGLAYPGLQKFNWASERVYMNNGFIAMSGANVANTVKINLPFHVSQDGTATIPEILKLFVNFNQTEVIANVAEGSKQAYVQLHLGPDAASMNSEKNICELWIQSRGAFTAGGTYNDVHNLVYEQDITDGKGVGIMCTQPLYLTMDTINHVAASDAKYKILYKIRTVGTSLFAAIDMSQK